MMELYFFQLNLSRKGRNFTELSSFLKNINWMTELHSLSIDQCYERFCEVYNEGGGTKWVPMVA